MSKVSAPESYTFSAIVAESNTEAEALVEEIKAANGNLAEIEAGANATTATIKMTELNERGAEKFVNAKVGDVFTYNYQNKPAAIVITELGKKDNFVLTANVNLEVVASPETHSEVDAKVKMLMNKAGKTPEAFAAAVQEMGTFAIPTIVKRDADAHRVNPVVTGIEDSRNIAVWAYDAKVGDKKSWSAKNVTYVCMITDINDEKYEAALNAFRESLRLNPEDRETKYNYVLTKRIVDQKRSQQQQNDNQDNNQNQNNQQDNNQQNNNQQNNDKNNQQNQQNQNNENQNQEQNQQQDKGDEEQKKEEPQEQPQQDNPQQLNSDKERMLDAIQAQEDKTQDKLKDKKKALVIPGKKNW